MFFINFATFIKIGDHKYKKNDFLLPHTNPHE